MSEVGLFGDGLIITLVGIFVLILLSAFFSGSETALTAASEARLHQHYLRGDQRADTVLHLKKRSDTLISTILIGNNITNVAASALASGVLIAMFGEAGVAYATIAMTLILVVFAEVLPKTVAINNADRTALAVAPVIRPLVRLLNPLSTVVRVAVQLLLRPFGLSTHPGPAAGEHEEELRGLIELHRGPGTDVSEERAMLRSILDLDDVPVSAIMTHRRNVVMIDAERSRDEVFDELMKSPYTRMPLYRGDQEEIIGVLHVRAVLREIHASGSSDFSHIDVESISSTPGSYPNRPICWRSCSNSAAVASTLPLWSTNTEPCRGS